MSMTKDPRSYNAPDGKQLRPDQIDSVARALLSLTRDVCVLTDRVMILEKVLDEKGMNISELVDTYQPGEAFKKEIRARTGTIIDEVVFALKGE